MPAPASATPWSDIWRERGHTTYATARKDRDLAALAELENVVPVRLDVRNPDQVREARELVLARGGGLYGLVNNAGIGPLGLFSTWTDEELRDLFDVNVFGVHRMTNAFLDLLLEPKVVSSTSAPRAG